MLFAFSLFPVNKVIYRKCNNKVNTANKYTHYFVIFNIKHDLIFFTQNDNRNENNAKYNNVDNPSKYITM